MDAGELTLRVLYGDGAGYETVIATPVNISQYNTCCRLCVFYFKQLNLLCAIYYLLLRYLQYS